MDEKIPSLSHYARLDSRFVHGFSISFMARTLTISSMALKVLFMALAETDFVSVLQVIAN